MNVFGKHYRTIWVHPENDKIIQIIDQRQLPHFFAIEDICSFDQMINAINEMHLRGAGLIGAAAGYGMYLASLEVMDKPIEFAYEHFEEAGKILIGTRPTAINLERAINRQLDTAKQATSTLELIQQVKKMADHICDEDADFGKRVGENGVTIIEEISRLKAGKPVNILTHCNAGWLALVDYGTALSPIYEAHRRGIPVHVWVDETRPLNQGARLTAWELLHENVPHTIITDNAGGHLMQHGLVDMVITGADRVLSSGDVANKIGTYLKALSAKDNDIPFYVALPSTTFDFCSSENILEVPIEKRDANEIKKISGLFDGRIVEVLLTPEESPAANIAFDVTPAHLITGLITERGICEASKSGIKKLFPENFY